MSTILVTGGAGFIGSNLSEELLKEGYSVRILDNLSTGKIENIETFKNDIEFIKGDIRDENTVLKALKEVGIVFHLAAVSSIDQSLRFPADTIDVNDTGTINLLEQAVKSGVEKFIFSSSAAVYGKTSEERIQERQILKPFSLYGISKMSGENYLKIYHSVYGIKTISFRFFNVFGPRQNPESEYSAVIPKFISLLANNRQPTIYGDGKQTRDFIFVKDLAAACIKAMNCELKIWGDCFNLGSGKETAISELLNTIKKITGKNIEPIYEPPRFEEVQRSCAAVNKAETILGFKAGISLEDGLKQTIEWF